MYAGASARPDQKLDPRGSDEDAGCSNATRRAEIEWRRALREGGHEKTTLEDLALEYIASSPLVSLKTAFFFTIC